MDTSKTLQDIIDAKDQVAFYLEHGYLHVPNIYTEEEMAQIEEEHTILTREWAVTSEGWTGGWRNEYMDQATEKASKLTGMHDLHFYSAAWYKAATHPKLVEVLQERMTDVLYLVPA